MNKIFTLIFIQICLFSFINLNGQTTIAFQSFEELASDTWGFTANPVEYDLGTDEWRPATSQGGQSPSDGANLWGFQDIDNNSFAGDHILAFDDVDVSTFTDISISFDWFSVSLNSTDEISYIVTIDGTPQTEVSLCLGCGTTAMTTETINIPNGTGTVSLQLIGNQNGGGQHGGWDNIKVEGTAATNETRVSFVAATSSLAEDGITIDVCVGIMNPDASAATTVQVNLDNSSTATNGTDYDDGSVTPLPIVFPQTLTFSAGSSMNQCVSFFISNDDTDVEGDETVVLNLENAAGGDNAALGSITQHVLTIVDNDIPTIADVRINELDSSPADDEFVELFGTPLLPLDGLILVFFNGNLTNDPSYNTVDLTGQSLDANGFFLVGDASAATPAPDLVITASIQDGIDAVGLYFDDAANFPSGTFPTTNNLVDALVYQSGTGDDADLRTALNFTAANNQADMPINESANNDRPNDSVQRGSWFTAPRTPRGANIMLPIELISFTATPQDRTTLLKWTTAMEINNDYMIVEASSNGSDFKEIGRISGAGTSNEINEYHFVDEQPNFGKNYYRLLQVDFDGTAAYSNVVIVDFEQNNGDISIYPNPTTDVLTVKFPTHWEGETVITVVNNLGQVVKVINTPTETFSVGDLPVGMYNLRVTNGRQSVSKFFVKG